MELFLYLVTLVAGFAAGGLLLRIVSKGETNAIRAVSEERAARLAALEQRLSERDAELQKVTASSLVQAEKLRALQEAQARLDHTFESVAARALKSNSESFRDTVAPLFEALGRFEESRSKGFATLETMVETLREANLHAAGQTAKLANALRSPTVRGRWGEMQLHNVVKLAGMEKHCDFDEQVNTGRLRPDMVVHLPDNRDIVIDAKVPLSAYLSAQETTDDAERERLLTAHAAHVRDRIRELSAKEYWDQFQPSPDFVVMFLPDESCFSAALRVNRELIEFGIRNRVLLATPTTLVALLKSAAYGWRHQEMAANAQAIADLGRETYNRLRIFTGHLDRVRGGLEAASTAYNAAAASLETRLLPHARKFKDYSAADGDDLASLPVETALRTLQPQPNEEM